MIPALIFLALVLLAPPPAAGSHHFPPDLEEQIITMISVEARTLTPEDIRRLTGLREGMTFSSRRIRKSMDTLYRTGLFKDIVLGVEPRDTGIDLQFRVTENVFIGAIRVSGQSLSSRQVQSAIGLKEGEKFSEDEWEAAQARLIDFYRDQGYFETQLTSDATVHSFRNSVALQLHIHEGPRAHQGQIRFSGHRKFPEIILHVTLGTSGAYYDSQWIRNGLDNLREFYQDRGHIKALIGPPQLDYDPKTRKVDVTIPIEAGIQVRVLFEGTFPKKLFSWKKDLEGKLLIREDRSIEDNVLDESRERLEQYFRDQGFPYVEISYRVERKPAAHQVSILFHIESGQRVLLTSIRFEGPASFSEKELRKVIRSKPTRFFIAQVFREQTIQDDIRALNIFYHSQGFLNPQIETATTLNPEKTRIELTFKIQEHDRTWIDQIRFTGHTRFSDTQILNATGLEKQTIYQPRQVQEAKFNILSLYSKQGYAFAEIHLDSRFKEDPPRVDLGFTIQENEPVRVGKIFLQGNTLTRKDVILRELTIRSDDPYDEERIRISEQKLYRLGFLSDVRLSPLSGTQLDIRDLLLSVTERKAGAFEFGVGFGEEERLRGFVEFSHRNLMGTGRRLRIRGELSQIQQKYTLNYTEPWFMGKDLELKMGLAHQVEKLESFDQRTSGGTVGLDKSFSTQTKGSVQYLFEQNECEDIKESAILTDLDRAQATLGSLNLSLIRDTRDDPFNPREGSLNGIIIKDSDRFLASESQFVKLTSQSGWYFPLERWLVLAVSARGGIIWPFGTTEAIHCSERFFLGGRSTIRGYHQDSVGIPGKTLGAGLTPIGGNVLLLFNSELRIQLPIRLGLVLFLDAGNVWPDYSDVQLSDFKYTAGAGLRYNTPVGPLRLDWGYKLDQEIGEDPWALHFTLGHAF